MIFWRRQADPPLPTDAGWSVTDTVGQAAQLLLYAIERGNEVKPEIRDPILRADTVIRGSGQLTKEEEAAFLGAYAPLAKMMSPVTATTLRASDRRFGRANIWSTIFRLRPLAEAQIQATGFGVLALVLLLLIFGGEWTRTFVQAAIEMQRELAKIDEDQRSTKLSFLAIERQLATLDKLAADNPNRAALRESLDKQEDEVKDRMDALATREDNVESKSASAHETLYNILTARGLIPSIGKDELKNVIAPLGAMLGGFVLPIFYGALGTCAYILRTIYNHMVLRSFEPSRAGEFIVRIFLGTISGVSLQWLFVGDITSIAGGLKPAGLAFVGGYGVELLFSAIDRALAAALGGLKGSAGAPTNGQAPITKTDAPGAATPARPAGGGAESKPQSATETPPAGGQQRG